MIDISNCEYIGGGGTKRALAVDNQRVILMPNAKLSELSQIDKQWERIIDDEIYMSNLLLSLDIPALTFERCQVKLPNGLIFATYMAPSFASYKSQNSYIIDRKERKSSQWDSCGNLLTPSTDSQDIEAWIRVLQPVIKDINTLVEAGIRLLGDKLNLVFVQRESPWHSKRNSEYEVRIFGFDFAHKINPLNRKRQKFDKSVATKMLRTVVEAAYWEIVNPRCSSLTGDQKKFWQSLVDILTPGLKFDD